MIPLYHDLTGETVLVFGGGSVGARKASRFAEETRVVVVSPEFDDRLIDDSAEPTESASEPVTSDVSTDPGAPVIEPIRAAPGPDTVSEWIDRLSPALVVAATDDAAINAAAEAAALDAGILVNRTDVSGDRQTGSVVVPATVDDDPVRVALSTGGASPALSKALRERIETEIDGAGAMAELSGQLRQELKDRDIPVEKRREAIRRVVRSESVWKGLQKGRSNARQEADSVIDEVLTQ